MKRWNILVLGLVGLLAITFVVAKRRTATSGEKERPAAPSPLAKKMRSPVLVELFTSEGCSSCPPADELLSQLEKEQPVPEAFVIVLSQHVDYWNRLGWADPYSAAAFSERQGNYAGAFGNDGVYTPQMIVDGKAEFVGSNAAKAREAIASAAKTEKATLKLTRGDSNASALALNVSVENLPAVSAGDTAEVLLAITENDLHSSVARGENAGRSLTHTAVVRDLSSLGNIREGGTFNATPTIKLSQNWKRRNLGAVVFVQEQKSRRVLGAAAINLASE